MSVVTNVILSLPTLEDHTARIAEINAWIANQPHWNREKYDCTFGPELSEQYDAYGGGKVLEATLYVGAFNHFPLDAFKDFLSTLNWEWPEEVQLLVKDSDDDLFSSFVLTALAS